MASPNDTARLLLVEDSVADAELIVHTLRNNGIDLEYDRLSDESALRGALQQDWDIVISAFATPTFNGLDAFKIVKSHQPKVPFIFVSGVPGEERVVEAMRAGASDYVVKDRLHRLPPIVARELNLVKQRSLRRKAERALKREQRRYQSIFESAAVALIELDLSRATHCDRNLSEVVLSGNTDLLEDIDDAARCAVAETEILAANDAATNLFGFDCVAGEQQRNRPETIETVLSEIWLATLSTNSNETTAQREFRVRLDDRELEIILAVRTPQTKSEFKNVVVSLLDVTEKSIMQRQLQTSMRLEAVGRLAGGIAHDFNNILTAISGHASLLAQALTGDETLRSDAQIIEDAARRAGGLTRQLLTFSRKQISEPQLINLNELVVDTKKLLQRVIGEDIELQANLAPDLGPIKIDPIYAEQILMNLVINAREAMPEGGRVIVETMNVYLDDAYSGDKPADIPPGEYTMVAISDNGPGIPSEVRSQIFEPFFTTKDASGGSGLGLSTVYGIVKRSGGYIWVYSEPQHGTTFKVYFPQVEHHAAVLTDNRSTTASPNRNGKTILLVEDEAPVRKVMKRILERSGYALIVASSGQKALELSRQSQQAINLLVTDVVLPKIDGKSLASLLTAERPELRVLYTSGYAESAIQHLGLTKDGVTLLPKPFNSEKLLEAVDTILDENHG